MKTANDYLEKDEWEELFEEIEQLEDYIDTYRNDTNGNL